MCLSGSRGGAAPSVGLEDSAALDAWKNGPRGSAAVDTVASSMAHNASSSPSLILPWFHLLLRLQSLPQNGDWVDYGVGQLRNPIPPNLLALLLLRQFSIVAIEFSLCGSSRYSRGHAMVVFGLLDACDSRRVKLDSHEVGGGG